MQTHSGGWRFAATRAVMLKVGERNMLANPPTGFGPKGFVQRLPLSGASSW